MLEPRHLGPRGEELAAMLAELGCDSLDELIDKAMPATIRSQRPLDLPGPLDEPELLADLRALAARNRRRRSYLGMGYHGCVTPPVLLRNILENPGWYTAYTPYQAEISQGRMEALLIFQTMVCDLTAMEIANASLLDEATAAAEAMTMCRRVLGRAGEARDRFVVSDRCHPQTIAVVRTRAEPLGIRVEVRDVADWEPTDDTFGVLLQYPATDGTIEDHAETIARAHDAGALAVVATDLLALTLLRPPGEMGADVVVGSSQRFGVPLGYGGPHAAFLATKDAFKRQVPGRIIGVTIDARGEPALRMALQTREQHIRREKATSNICTAQVLLAVMAAMYAVYHGPEGLRGMAERVRRRTGALAQGLRAAGCEVAPEVFFDTLRVRPGGDRAAAVLEEARGRGINLRDFGDGSLGIALDETVTGADVADVLGAFGVEGADIAALERTTPDLPETLRRESAYLEHPVFHRYRSETEMMRYLHRLEQRDLSLTTSMIPLGSCTMKLNAAVEMMPITWPEFADLHPFAPLDQAEGYAELISRLEAWLMEITGFSACSMQPNAGSQGEYTGLMVIRAYHRARGDEGRNVCLIPSSAHGTNPASAVLAGMRVVTVGCDDQGNIDVDDLRAKAAEHAERLGALMVTYPSTHGVFEAAIKDICAAVHEHGGQVYLDGANLNALVGLSRPAELGADVCHLNLHKTFCIPHGGGGPGMGPICVAEHLAPFLPGHPVVPTGGDRAIPPVAAAPFGSPGILPISYAYVLGMGPEGLRRATQVAILNANYVAARLREHFPVLYTGQNGFVAHECILDLRPLERETGVSVVDVAKRLMDYGFHAPTMSWPVAGTLMVEPTESESRAELDRFCEAMVAIAREARTTPELVKNAPHPAPQVCGDEWEYGYGRMQAAFPAAWQREHKYWPHVARVNDVYGDRNLVCRLPETASGA